MDLDHEVEFHLPKFPNPLEESFMSAGYEDERPRRF